MGKLNIDNNCLLIIVLVLIVLIYMNNHTNETLVNYKEQPLGNFKSGVNTPNGLKYYRRDRHRKPYNWPACHMVDYPVRHCKNFD